MKRILKYFTIASLAAGLVSCNFLDENMSTKYQASDIYGSEAALEAAVLGCYAQFGGSGFKVGSMNEWLQPASAILHWGGVTGRLTDGQKRWVDCLSLTRFSKDPNNLSNFKSLYTSVYKCNKLIEELAASPVNEAFKTQIEAEARFIRAEAYFYIVRLWGDCPLQLTAPKTIEDTNLPRSPFWKVYGQIIADLEFAEQNMRSYEEQKKYTTPGSGRVCKHAATAAKSIVYLTIGTLLAHSGDNDNFWTCSNAEVFNGFGEFGINDASTAFQKALDAAMEVMPETSTTGSPYRLATHYADLFKWTEPEDFELPERIFCLTSCNEISSNSTLAMWSLPKNYMNTDDATNFGRIRPSRFLFQEWCRNYSGTFGSGDAADIYVSCPDPRLDAAFIHTSYLGKGNKATACYPAANCIYCGITDYSKPLPYFKKYYDPKYNYTAGYADLYLIRLAEIYLVAAEACANLDNLPDAARYVNIVLRRARQTEGGEAAEPQDWPKDGSWDKQTFIKRIFWERCFELTGEQHEYYDTHRMGAQWLAENVTIPHNNFLTNTEQADWGEDPANPTKGHASLFYGAQRADFGGGYYPITQETVRKGLIHAYPNDELVYNSALTLDDQNKVEVFWE